MKIENLTLSGLKYFLDAVEFQSISLSAEKNHVSRPAVSQAVTRLEEWYGKRLLVHEKRRFELTKDGKSFYKKAQAAYANFSSALLAQEIQEKSLKIGCSNSLTEFIFPLIDRPIKESENPVIKVGGTHLLISQLKSKSINIAFAIDTGQISGLQSYEIKKGQFHLFSKTGDFADTLITTESRPEVDSLKKICFKHKIKFQNHVQVDSWSVAQKMAQLGLGCCLIPDFMKTARLEPIKIPTWKFEYSVVALARPSSELTQLEEKLLESAKVHKNK